MNDLYKSPYLKRKEELFRKIKSINPNAKESNYRNISPDQMQQIYNKMLKQRDRYQSFSDYIRVDTKRDTKRTIDDYLDANKDNDLESFNPDDYTVTDSGEVELIER